MISTNLRIVVATKTTIPGQAGVSTDFHFFKSRVNPLSPDIEKLTIAVSAKLKEKGINPIALDIISFSPLLGNETEI